MEFTFAFIKLFLFGIYLVSPLLALFSFVIIILGLLVCRLEQWKIFDGLYWSFITATTVGYGDIRPLKKRSKVLAVCIAFLGLMFTGIIVAVTLNTSSVAFEMHVDQGVLEEMKESFK